VIGAANSSTKPLLNGSAKPRKVTQMSRYSYSDDDRSFLNVVNSINNGAQMPIYSLSREEVRRLIEILTNSTTEVLVGTDPIDDAFKIKVDGGIWSPPMGRDYK
jgi:hypothetical protein